MSAGLVEALRTALAQGDLSIGRHFFFSSVMNYIVAKWMSSARRYQAFNESWAA